MTSYMELEKALDKEKLVNLVMDMVSIESHPRVPTYEENISLYIHNFLKSNGIDSTLQKVDEHRYNVLATIEGQNRDKNLLFTGHIDTVEDYGYPQLFKPYIKDNKIFGRGTSDMKGPVGSMIMAAILLKKLGIKPKYNLQLAFVVDEEFKSIGTEGLIKSGIKADGAILGEPTKMNVCIGHKGLEWLNIEVYGKGTHGGSAEEGINAIVKAAKLITRIDEKLLPKIKAKVDPILGYAIMNFGVVSGGYQPSTVPDKCTIKIDRRWISGETIEDIYAEYQSIIDELAQEDKDFKAKLFRDDQNMNEMEHGPVVIDKEHPIVKGLIKYGEEVTGKTPEIKTFTGWSDAALLSNFGGIPTVIFAPGDISTAHSNKEYVDIDQLVDATIIYALMGINFGD